MDIRPFREADELAVIASWRACGLTRPWNDPRKDIARKLAVQRELFLVGEVGGNVIGSVMGGYDAIAAGSTTWRCIRIFREGGTARL
jgi:hypothetical protein